MIDAIFDDFEAFSHLISTVMMVKNNSKPLGELRQGKTKLQIEIKKGKLTDKQKSLDNG